jgi:hypothetical protein
MHPELVEGGALSGLDPDRRWVLAGSTWTELMTEAGAKILRIAPERRGG